MGACVNPAYNKITKLCERSDIRTAVLAMFRFPERYYKDQAQAVEFAVDLVISRFSHIHKLEYSEPIPYAYVDDYVSLHGKWGHNGGHTVAHNLLGMRWAGWRIALGDDIELLDSPDIIGYTPEQNQGCRPNIKGDIGQCSFFPAFLATSFDAHDLWVSVFEWGEYVMEAFVGGMGNKFKKHTEAECPICNPPFGDDSVGVRP